MTSRDLRSWMWGEALSLMDQADRLQRQFFRMGAGAAACAWEPPAGLRDRALIEVLYGSGLRRQEACDLVISSIDFEHETLSVVGKGGHARTVPMTEPFRPEAGAEVEL